MGITLIQSAIMLIPFCRTYFEISNYLERIAEYHRGLLVEFAQALLNVGFHVLDIIYRLSGLE